MIKLSINGLLLLSHAQLSCFGQSFTMGLRFDSQGGDIPNSGCAVVAGSIGHLGMMTMA